MYRNGINCRTTANDNIFWKVSCTPGTDKIHHDQHHRNRGMNDERGVGSRIVDSARYLRKNRGLLGALLRRRAFRPDLLLSSLGPALADPAAGVSGLHLYAFDQIAEAVEWRARTLQRLR